MALRPRRPPEPAMGDQPDQSNSHDATPDPAASGTPPEKGWVEKLAEKSAGLPGKDEPGPTESEESQNSALWKFAGLGIQFAGTIGLMAWLGYSIDRWR